MADDERKQIRSLDSSPIAVDGEDNAAARLALKESYRSRQNLATDFRADASVAPWVHFDSALSQEEEEGR